MTYGYNIVSNFISDLGSRTFTPVPFLFNYGMILSALLLLPTMLYANKKFGLLPTDRADLFKQPRLRTALNILGYLLTCIALMGLIGVGGFPEGTDSHFVFAIFAFIGLINAGICFGIIILVYPTPIPRPLGIYMILVPAAFICCLIFKLPPSDALYEWLTFISLLGWILPCSFILRKQLNQEVKIPSWKKMRLLVAGKLKQLNQEVQVSSWKIRLYIASKIKMEKNSH